MEENYSIQAENLMSGIFNDYIQSLSKYCRDNLTITLIKSLKFKLQDRYKRIEDLSSIEINQELNKFQLLVYNTDYIEILQEQINTIDLEMNMEVEGQFIYIEKPKLSYNNLMSIVDDIEKNRNSFITKISKAKLEPILRSRHGVENQFIDSQTAQKASTNSQLIYERYEKKINEITQKKIKEILTEEYFEKYKEENFSSYS